MDTYRVIQVTSSEWEIEWISDGGAPYQIRGGFQTEAEARNRAQMLAWMQAAERPRTLH